MSDKFYVTTPIYYVNAQPHLGHVYTTVIADVLARYNRLNGRDVFFQTGTDEHGDKIVETAAKQGTTAQAMADENSAKFRDIWPEMNVAPDNFIRTTDEDHKRVVQSILQKVYDSGDIYFGEYGGHYCVGCERFIAPNEIEDGKCPDHQTELEYVQEQNYFFKMEKYRPWLLEHIEKNPDFIRPERYKNEVLGMLREPLDDLCISRPKSRLEWGIELPFDENYVCYVWFDALINYLTGIGYPDGEKFEGYWAKAQHLIAKDIVKPHAIYWPTMLKSMGLEPAEHLNVHGYWNVDATKMSKSLGNAVDPLELKNTYGLDAFRYFLVREMVFGLDSNFSEEALVNRFNADLANDLGNLTSRSAKMVSNYFGGELPACGELSDADSELRNLALRSVEEYVAKMEGVELHNAMAAVWQLISGLNKYIDTMAPWVLAKEDQERLATVLYHLMESLRFVGVMIQPVMPETSAKILSVLGIEKVCAISDLESFGVLEAGTRIGKVKALFPRVEKKSEKQPEKVEKKEPDNLIDIKEFGKVEIKVGRILAAEAVKKSEKLLVMKVDTGEERQIVAGIAKSYEPSELVGKHVAVVCNLKPAKLMGIESQGMMLATDMADGRLSLIGFDREVKVGSRIR